jgi:FAD/FMN-containing dehydrogenase
MTGERVVITQAFWFHPTDLSIRESLREVLVDLKAADMKYGYIPYGVGKLYRQELISNINPTYLEYIRKIKTLFDPNGILNPGNNVF